MEHRHTVFSATSIMIFSEFHNILPTQEIVYFTICLSILYSMFYSLSIYLSIYLSIFYTLYNVCIMILVYTSIICKASGPCRIYIYICNVCVYARESVMYYINIYIYTHIYIYIHTYIHIYIYIYIYISFLRRIHMK